MKNKASIAAAVAICGALSGCVTEQQKAAVYGMQRPVTSAERAAIANYVRTSFFDPYSMRDIAISNVLSGDDPKRNAVCIRANAKNRMGAYTGLRATGLVLSGATVENSWADDPACSDPRLMYSPFPELERL